MNSNVIKIIKVLIAVFVLGTVVYFGEGVYKKFQDNTLNGIVETNVYSNVSEVSGKIISLNLEPGMDVKKGSVIAVIDDTALQFSLTQAEANLVKAKETLVGLSGNTDKNAVESAVSALKISESSYENANLVYEKAKDDFEKNKILFEAGGLSETSLKNYQFTMDQALNAVQSSKAQIENAKAGLNSVVNGAGSDKIRAAKASIVLAQSQVDQIKDQISKTSIKAVCDGIIISRNYLLGDFVSPGFDIVDIASEKDKYIKVYYPEDQINNISFGQELKFTFGENEYSGKISFIDIETQYTPTELQSSANKNKDSFLVKIKYEENIPLKVGQKVKIYPAE